MYKAVFDTNVYISAAVFGGNPELLLRLCRPGRKRYELFTSHEIIKETVRVLGSEKFGFDQQEIQDAISTIVRAADVVEPKTTVSACVDETDNRILECAIEAKVDFIVSGDKHLLDLKEYKGIAILKPAQFLELLKRQ